MPLIHGKDGSWRFGEEGKVYRGKGAKQKALKQGRAIEASKNRQRMQTSGNSGGRLTKGKQSDEEEDEADCCVIL
jgi:hypothetical protein